MTEDNNISRKHVDSPDQRRKDIKRNGYLRQTVRLFNRVFLVLLEYATKTFAFISLVFKENSKKQGAIGDISQAFSHLNFKKLAMVGAGALIGLYLLTGIYVVNPGEVAVVKLFGKVVKDRVSEGLHYRLPWPFESVDLVNISTIRREGIGFLLPEHQSIHSSPKVIQFLTGDENIIDIQAIVQYRVKDAASYLYNVKYPPYLLINEMIRSAITEIGGNMLVDEILTIGKERLQGLIRAKAQKILDRYQSGLQLIGINLNKVYPPEEVAESFRDVSNAKQDREKTINDAWGYLNSIIPLARGDANKIIREAEAYKIDVMNRARGEAKRFEKMFAEYEKNNKIYSTDVTRYRLYLESMEKVMSRVKKYMVIARKGGKINLRLFDGE
ncbi:MAG: FtsH protease activity modulator HflK [Deltaproteobacteria bacterium]|nr:FtsH protease activity modulator HflK [Deltaproteobacteria bacterium]